MTALAASSKTPVPRVDLAVATDAAKEARNHAEIDAWNSACCDLVGLTCAPSDWVESGLTARQFGIDVSLLLSWALYVEVEQGALAMQDLMDALAGAGRAAAWLGHSIELGTTLPTVATCLGDVQGKPIVAIRLGS